MKDYYVAIIRTADNMPVKVLGPMDDRRADRVEDGMSINLDWDNYHTAQCDEAEFAERPDWQECHKGVNA